MAKDDEMKNSRIKVSLSHATWTRQFFLLSEKEGFKGQLVLNLNTNDLTAYSTGSDDWERGQGILASKISQLAANSSPSCSDIKYGFPISFSQILFGIQQRELDRGNWRQAMMVEFFSFLRRKESFSSTKASTRY